MVLRQGVVQIALGMTLGGAAALAIAAVAGNGIQTTLFGVSARDPLTYGLVFAIVTIVSLVATMVPARRATRVDPMIALRAE
jgi:ABC-type antimicrobial peptide transport system permease subunit